MNIKILKGKTITAITGAEKFSTEIAFCCSDGTRYRLFHSQNCCELVDVEDVTGDIADIIGSKILLAEEVSQKADDNDNSRTWTFYKLATIKGSVTIRWLGKSNGYYSERVDFEEVDNL